MTSTELKFISGNQSTRADLMQDHGFVAKIDEGLGTLSVNGRRRVPKPPTRMSAFMVVVLLLTQLPTLSKYNNQQKKDEHP
jgi:hypothetical protein